MALVKKSLPSTSQGRFSRKTQLQPPITPFSLLPLSLTLEIDKKADFVWGVLITLKPLGTRIRTATGDDENKDEEEEKNEEGGEKSL